MALAGEQRHRLARGVVGDAERTFALVASGPETEFAVRGSGSAGEPLVARLSLDRGEDRRMLARLAILLAASALLGGAIAALTAAWGVRRGLAPLQDLAGQARAIDARRAGQRLQLARPTEELQGTVDQFNALMGRLEHAQQQLEAYNGNVAHELRGLLGALIGPAELALSRQRSSEALRDALATNVEGLRALAGTVNDMLFLARVEHGAAPRRGSPRSLAALVREVIDFHEAALEEARLEPVIAGDAVIAVDAPLVKRAVSNLVSNATRYARRGTPLVLRLSSVQDRAARIVVENEGPPIDGALLSRIFDRFVRADAAASSEGSNHGLGLAIVAAVARMHGGEAWLMAVADGVGGRAGGAEASSSAVETTLEYLGQATGCYHRFDVDEEQKFIDKVPTWTTDKGNYFVYLFSRMGDVGTSFDPTRDYSENGGGFEEWQTVGGLTLLPEPGTYAAIGVVGLAAAGVWRRSRRSKA